MVLHPLHPKRFRNVQPVKLHPSLPCSWNNVLIGYQTRAFWTAHTKRMAGGLWGATSWIWQKGYWIRIVDCTFKCTDAQGHGPWNQQGRWVPGPTFVWTRKTAWEQTVGERTDFIHPRFRMSDTSIKPVKLFYFYKAGVIHKKRHPPKSLYSVL